jgi:hypothetical protein
MPARETKLRGAPGTRQGRPFGDFDSEVVERLCKLARATEGMLEGVDDDLPDDGTADRAELRHCRRVALGELRRAAMATAWTFLPEHERDIARH